MISPHKDKIFHGEPKFWGATSVGERGQVVIPAKARKFLKLKKGDKLLVVSKGDKLLGFLKVDEISAFLKKWLSKLEEIKKS
jgi:AbrB family looped-hinge helix DNA binding protein